MTQTRKITRWVDEPLQGSARVRIVRNWLHRASGRGTAVWIVALLTILKPAHTHAFLTQAETELSYVADLIAQLEREVADLVQAERAADSLQQPVVRASMNVRLLAADVLAAAGRAKSDASSMMLDGLTLTRGRSDLDGSLKKFLSAQGDQPNGDPQLSKRITAIWRAVREFNDRATSLSRNGNAFDERPSQVLLSEVLAPLADAVSQIDNTTVTSHWVSNTEVAAVRSGALVRTPPRVDENVSRPSPSPDALESRLAAALLPDQTRAELVSIIDFLKRGGQFPELRPRVELYRRVVWEMLDLAEEVRIAAESWMKPAVRDSYQNRLHEAAALFKNPESRETGQRHVERLSRSREVLALIGALAKGQTDVRPIVAALLAAEAVADEPAKSEMGVQQLSRLALVLERMIEYRELEAVNLKKDLRVIERDLNKAYRDAEEKLIQDIGTFAEDPGSLADPAFMSLLTDQKQHLEDLRRLRDVQSWIEAIEVIDPPSAEPFAAQTRKMSQWLLDQNRRPDAVLAMDQFERQLSMFATLPYEPELRAADPQAIELAAGMNGKLAEAIAEQRRAWAKAWSEGNAGSDAAGRMLLLHRLTQLMADVAALAPDADGGAQLNRWSAWEIAPAMLQRPMSDVSGRLKLATVSAIKGNPAELTEQLARLDRDAPLVKLVGRLSAVLHSALEKLPAGGAGVVGQLIHPPEEDSWMVSHRGELAELCRLSLEQEYARLKGRGEAVAMLNQQVNALADRLLAELGEPQDAMPTLPGFDGSDPNAKTP